MQLTVRSPDPYTDAKGRARLTRMLHGTIKVAKENMTDQKYRTGEITKYRASEF